MDEALIRRIDAAAGRRGRSQFVRDAVEAALSAGERRALVMSARGTMVMLPIGKEEGWRAGDWTRRFASRGVTLSQADCLIAAAAATHGAVHATGNPRDFPMRGVRVDHWPVGG